MQPVFHVYDLHYYLFPPGIIDYSQPERNKYCNFTNIETIDFKKLDDYKLNKFTNFVQSHYLKNGENVFLPKKENIIPYFLNHTHPCFFSFYTENEFLFDTKTNTTIEDKKIISVMACRPLHIYINNYKEPILFDAYYGDYLCVDKNYRKKSIAPQMIHTHHYNQRLLNKNICVGLFKREDELTGIVPICVYKTYGFETQTWKRPPRLPPYLGIVEIGEKNAYHLFDLIKTSHNNFDIVIIPEISNLIELIKTKNIYCYIIVRDYKILSAYFFRRTCAYIRKNAEIISCFSSINNSDILDVFVEGFKIAIWKLCNKHSFNYAVIEDIGNNADIIKNIKMRTPATLESPTAYFFGNFAYPTFKSSKCLIIQ